MLDKEITGILDSLRKAEQLKNTIRTSKTSLGRDESTAEHTWRLCLMVLLFAQQYPEADILKLLKICIIHDLGEAVNGDIAAVDQIPGIDKGIEERKDLQSILEPLPENLKNEILSLWDEYENVSSKEALIAKSFDKLETLLQHTQGKNPPGFIDYEFNLGYGKKYTDLDELTVRLRKIIDIDTKRLAEQDKKTGNKK